MRIRQPDPEPKAGKKAKTVLAQTAASRSTMDSQESLEATHRLMDSLEEEFDGHRRHWTGNWRAPTKTITGCEQAFFEVVADQLFPGDTEIEVWVTGTDN